MAAFSLVVFLFLGGESWTVASGSKSKALVNHGNGTIASMVELSDTNTDVKVYRLFYWSDQKKVEAYLSIPNQPGKYPIYLLLHGGYVLPTVQHNLTQIGGTVVWGSAQSHYFPPGVLTFMPAYRGYGESGGNVDGLERNLTDVENGLSAVASLGRSRPRDVYVWGVSMGGTLGLMLAAHTKNIRAVIAVSPFAGFDITKDWLVKLHWNSRVPSIRNNISNLPDGEYTYPSGITLRSPYDMTASINAPVLLLIGGQDKEVIWQTVRSLYLKMKKEHKNVTYIFFPAGNHALTSPTYVREGAYQDEFAFYYSNGLALRY